MGDVMSFPDAFEEFAEQYKIIDKQQIYTNGTELIPIFRVKQWLYGRPVSDAIEVRHGRWVHTGYAMHWHGKDECSECTYHTFGRDDLSHFNFCPNCGAKMDKGEEENAEIIYSK